MMVLTGIACALLYAFIGAVCHAIDERVTSDTEIDPASWMALWPIILLVFGAYLVGQQITVTAQRLVGRVEEGLRRVVCREEGEQ